MAGLTGILGDNFNSPPSDDPTSAPAMPQMQQSSAECPFETEEANEIEESVNFGGRDSTLEESKTKHGEMGINNGFSR